MSSARRSRAALNASQLRTDDVNKDVHKAPSLLASSEGSYDSTARAGGRDRKVTGRDARKRRPALPSGRGAVRRGHAAVVGCASDEPALTMVFAGVPDAAGDLTVTLAVDGVTFAGANAGMPEGVIVGYAAGTIVVAIDGEYAASHSSSHPAAAEGEPAGAAARNGGRRGRQHHVHCRRRGQRRSGRQRDADVRFPRRRRHRRGGRRPACAWTGRRSEPDGPVSRADAGRRYAGSTCPTRSRRRCRHRCRP